MTRIGSAVFLCLNSYLKHIDHVRVITVVTCYCYRTVLPAVTLLGNYWLITHYPFIISIYDYPVTGNVQLRVVFDPTYPGIDMLAFIKMDWKPMYVDVKEAIPPNAPVAKGK
jgi:hypothetical protein